MVATVERRYERRARFDIVEEHFEEADFVYAQRALLLQSRANDLAALARWDERLLAHFDGLLTQLETGCADAHAEVCAAACVAAGRMRAHECLSAIEQQLDAAEPEVRFAAVRAGLLLSSARALQRCRAAIAQRDLTAGDTLRLLGMVGASADHALTLSVLDEPDLTLAAIDALGWFGDPGAVGVLLRYLDLPQWTTATAQSIQRITGVNFAAEQLLAEPPPATSGADEAAELAAFTPRPDADKMRAWWSTRQNRYGAGERYFAGQACNASAEQSIKQRK